jgi:hypothetical protein
MHARGRVDELPADAQPVACLSDAAFENVTNPQFASNLLGVSRSPSVGKTGVPCDDKEAAKARQSGDNLLDNTICEILLVPIAAQILEW